MAKDFPEFVIEAIVDAECIGRVELTAWVGEGRKLALRVGDRFVWAHFVLVDKSTGAVRVRVEQDGDVAALTVGASYPFFDDYWGWQAELVLDRARAWHRETFRPVDAVQYISYRADGRRTECWTKATAEREGGTLIPGGWDHEHCELCYEKIGHGGVAEGWTDGQGNWLCESCHDTRVVPRSIEFIPVE